MKFFKWLSIIFPIYGFMGTITVFALNHEGQSPYFLELVLRIVGFSLILLSKPFAPLLKAMGMYTPAYYSFATTGGIVLSLIIWEAIFLVIYFFFSHIKKDLTIK
jgi:hypothetical protein